MKKRYTLISLIFARTWFREFMETIYFSKGQCREVKQSKVHNLPLL